jgi:hypothetical protein
MQSILEMNLLSQQEELIKLQILLHALVDELVETDVISAESLDSRLKEKVDLVNKIIEKQKEKLHLNDDIALSNIFNAPMGEA